MKCILFSSCCLLFLPIQSFASGFIVIHHTAPERPREFAPLELSEHHVEVKIEGQIARTRVEQQFFNPTDRPLEGTYMFPVPKGANIEKFSMEIDDRMVDAELLPAEKARKIYEDIVRKQRDPALLEYAGRDLFKVRVFPIEPRSKKQIKLSYTELLRSDAGASTYIHPLSGEKFSAQPIKSLSLKITLQTEQPLASIYSPSHEIEIKRDGDKRAIIGYEARDAKPDGDFHLVFTSARDVAVNLLSYKKPGEDGAFLLLAAPPASTEKSTPAPKDVAFVLDTSGSMAGGKLDQAKKALAFCVENLNADDRFEVVRFSTEVESLFGKVLDADSKNRKRASEFIRDLKPTGGTAIAAALETAVKLRPDAGDRPFIIIFLTDGLPTVGTRDENAIIATVKKSGKNVRVFSFGVGTDVNTHLLDRIAESTRAFSQYVLPTEDIEVKVSNFFTRVREPVLTNLHLEFSGLSVSKMYPAELPDLFAGDQLVITGRYSGSGKAKLKLRGTIAGRDKTFDYDVQFAEGDTTRDFIPRLWAIRRVGFLLDEIRLRGENQELRDEVTELAREFGIVTPYTAYLIVEDEEQKEVPLAQRSLRELDADEPARRRMDSIWEQFRNAKSGPEAVGGARAQNVFKQALRPQDSVESNRSEALAGFVAEAPAAAAEARRLAGYTQQTTFVNGRAFFKNGAQWIDSQTHRLNKRVQVQFNSNAYFELLGKHPEAAPWLALGQNLLLALDDTIYEISE